MKTKKPLGWGLAVFLLLALGGCGSSGEVREDKPQAPAVSAPAGTAPAGKKPGGYYLDDGPGDNPPANIDAIPDAVPKPEKLLARTNRPYSALGQTYVPMTRYQPYKASGVASWYGRRYHGQKTSSGELYDMYGMTAAHTILPIPSYARVTNPDNGRSVVVRINDRGPFKDGRLIDLSYAAAYKLRLADKGSGPVQVEAIPPTGEINAAPKPPAPLKPAQAKLPAAGSYLQIGAFKQPENATRLRLKLQQQNLAPDVAAENWYNDGLYRVRLGPYPNRDEAERAAAEIKRVLGTTVLLITQ